MLAWGEKAGGMWRKTRTYRLASLSQGRPAMKLLTWMTAALTLAVAACGGDQQEAQSPDTSKEVEEAGEAVGEDVEEGAEEAADEVQEGVNEAAEEVDEATEPD